MATKYKLKDDKGVYHDISFIPEFKQYLIDEQTIHNHISAQLEYYRGLKQKKLAPIMISVTDEKFKVLVKEVSLCFPDDQFFISNEIPIFLGESNIASILIINEIFINND